MVSTTSSGSDIGWELRVSARNFLSKEVPISLVRESHAAQGMSLSLWKSMADQGWFRLLVGEPNGGLALTLRDVGPLFMELGEYLPPGPVLDHVVVGPLLINSGVEGPLLNIVSGQEVVVFADPQVDSQGIELKDLPRVDDGRLQGEVQLIRCGTQATYLIAAAIKSKEWQFLQLPVGGEGVEVKPVESFDPVNSYATASFDRMLQPGDVVLSGEAAEEALLKIRTASQLMAACELSGISSRLSKMSQAYALARSQFGRPIGSFQAIKHLLADMAVKVTALQNLCATSLDQADSWSPALTRIAAVTKAYASETARSVAEQSLQIHGGMGFLEEHDLHLFFKRALALQGFYGDERQLATSIGAELLAATGLAPIPSEGEESAGLIG